MSFFTCGFDFDSNESIGSDDFETLLLHGAKFSKDDWKIANILSLLCLRGDNDYHLNRKTRVVAADLHVSVDGNGLHSASQSLKMGNYFS